MKLAIIGSAGLPAKYGGFETLVEHLVINLTQYFEITVYCSSKNNQKLNSFYNGAKLEYISLKANGIQSILYDIISLYKSSKDNNVILILGVSGCIVLPFYRLFYKKKRLIINIDGLEHKRAKWPLFIKVYLKLSERIAIIYGNVIIADNYEIQNYLLKEYGKESILIAYGGDHVFYAKMTNELFKHYKIPTKYAFKVCRIEPENNIECILSSFSISTLDIVIVGNWDDSKYGKDLKRRFNSYNNIHLINSIYQQEILNQIRSNCLVYIHGHSAGGTNPSLVEAMNLGLPIIAFDVSYNRVTTMNKALYFKNSYELNELITNVTDNQYSKIGRKMKSIAKEYYTWDTISLKYKLVLTDEKIKEGCGVY